VHGENHPELHQVKQAFAELRAELEPHMFKEERILFPAIRMLEQSESPPAFPFGAVANPIRMMELEHDHAGDALERIRTLTGDYRIPEGACNTYRAMLARLQTLEQDMHLHVHKENNILFPRAIELESSPAKV
jgi:regulator of cell morphogenesis and NO signaling